jgi:hypothetical protein
MGAFCEILNLTSTTENGDLILYGSEVVQALAGVAGRFAPFDLKMTACSQCTGVPVHTHRILLSGLATHPVYILPECLLIVCRLVHRCTRTRMPHPPGMSFRFPFRPTRKCVLSVPVHTRHILPPSQPHSLSAQLDSLLIVQQFARTQSLHPPPWPDNWSPRRHNSTPFCA